MIYLAAIFGGFAASVYVWLGLSVVRALLAIRRENRQPLAVREAQEVAAQAWRVS